MGVAPIASYPEALAILRAQADLFQLPTEKINLLESVGRVVAEDIFSGEVIPHFANSAMDGFAVRSWQTHKASPQKPLRLLILGNLAAGDDPASSDDAVGAWEIMTGAPFPENFDACARLEDVEIIRDSQGKAYEIELRHPVTAGLNRREIGEDFQLQAKVISRGQRVRPEDLLVLASLGITTLSVFKKVKVAIISTGKELVPISEKPGPGKIRNSSGPFLIAFLQNLGVHAEHLATLGDDPQKFRELLAKIPAGQFDLILTTGAISMGKYDFVAHTLKDLKAHFFFQKVAMRPGKPILFAQLENKTFLMGLPGNPISGAVGLRFFVQPFLRTLQKRTPEIPLRLPLRHSTQKPSDVYSFFKGNLHWSAVGSSVELHPQQRPSLLHSLVQSEVWIALSEAADWAEGQYVDVFPY